MSIDPRSEDVDKMSNEELDEAIAREVMGYHESSSDFYQWQTSNGEPVNDATEPWRPTRDIELAFQVVDVVINKMDDTCGFNISGIFPGSGDSPAIYAEFQPCMFLSSPAPFRGDGASVQEAICRAAVKFARSKASLAAAAGEEKEG